LEMSARTLAKVTELCAEMDDEWDFWAESLEMYSEEEPDMLEKINKAIAESDGKSLKEHAHYLKGSSLALGLVDIAETCQVMEDKGPVDPAGCAPLVDDLKAGFATIPSIIAFCQSKIV